jgi:hypothetical protein
MRIDGDQADDELLGNLSAGQALCEQPQYLHLTRGEPGMKQRKRRARCRGWGGESRLWERFQVEEDVFWCHHSPFGPGGGKGLLPQVRAHGSDSELMHSLRKGWQRRPDGLTKRLGGTHEPHCPDRLSLRCRHEGLSIPDS